MSEYTLSNIFDDHSVIGARTDEPDAVASVLAKGQGQEQERGMAQLLTDYYLQNRMPIKDDTRALLIEKIIYDGIEKISESDLARVCLLVQGVDLHKQMDGIDSVLKKYLYPKIAESEQFEAALGHWRDWDKDTKMGYGIFFSREFCLIARIPNVRVENVTLPRTEEDVLITARCLDLREKGKIVQINDFEEMPLADLKTFHHAIYHELIHAVQMYIADCVIKGEIGAMRPELKTAGMLMAVMFNRRVYDQIFKSHTDYQSLGIEDHAEGNARDFVETLHDPVKRQAAVQKSDIIKNTVSRSSRMRGVTSQS